MLGKFAKHTKLLLLGAITLVYASPQGPDAFETYPDLRCPLSDLEYLVPHEYDPAKFYYCQHGVRLEEPQDCTRGTEFSYELQTCNWPETLSAGIEDEDGGSEGGTDKDGGIVGAAVDAGGLLPNCCPANFSVHWLLPNHEDCNKFYYCVFGELVERTCPPDMDFNPVLQVCDWPWDAGCKLGGINECDATHLANACPSDFTIHWLLPHADCTKFYYCNFGEKLERSCPPDLHFNKVKQVCDYPWRAGCE